MIGFRHQKHDQSELHSRPDKEDIERPSPGGILIDEPAYQGSHSGSNKWRRSVNKHRKL